MEKTFNCKSRKFIIAGIIVLLISICLSLKTKAATPYMIKINKGTNVVTVYKQNNNGYYATPVTAFVCSTGYATPIGTFPLGYKMRWGTLMGPSYGQYCSVITGNFLFHSVWYYSAANHTQSYVEYNRLGTTASHGCVRLTTIDAKWIYDNCASGTPVKIFYGSAQDDKLGKPKFIRVSGYSGWDPTDPSPNNPYRKDFPTFSGLKNRKISAFTKFNPIAGIKAKDGDGKNITKNIKVSGKVNIKKEGTYPLTYVVKDQYHRPTVKEIKVTVVDRTKPIIKGIKNRTYRYGKQIDFLKGVKAKMKNGTNITDSLTYTVKPDLSGPGEYEVRYTAKGTNGKKSSKTVVYTILEPSEEDIRNMFQGVEDKTLTMTPVVVTEEEKVDFIKEHALDSVSGKYVDGELIEKDDYEIIVTNKAYNQYDVQYILEDSDGYEITKSVVFILV